MVEQRLLETGSYRADLDLVIVDTVNEAVAYGLFWFDARTRVALSEPMRTDDAHQRRGLGRSILTHGIARLVDLGATRIKINLENDNAASGALYTDVGFVPTMTTSPYIQPT